MAVIGCVALLTGVPSRASAAALATALWSASATTTGATGVAYTFTVTPATTSTLTKVTMTVPSGTTGTPAVGTVSPSAIAGGTVSLSGGTLSYTFASVTMPAPLSLSIQITGLTNTGAANTYTSTITTYDNATAVDGGTATFAFTGSAFTKPGWSVSSATLGATGTSYTYTFTPSATLTALSVTMSVPPGTTGTPTIGTVSPPGIGLLSGVSLSGNTLTLTSLGLALTLGSAVSIQVNGLTNTSTAGNYVPEIAAFGLLGNQSAIAPAVSFPGYLAVGAPATLSWAGTLTGRNQTLVDGNASDQQVTVNDQTNTGNGWHVTVAATSFTNGSGYSLPAAGVLTVTGSVTNSGLSVGPTAACAGSVVCALPNNSAVTYPVAITTAATSPVAQTVYDARAYTGVGPVSLGGSSAANPVGWWVAVPALAQSGTYSSTVTISIVSGP